MGKPRFALRRAARVLAVSRFTARLVEEVGVAAGRILTLVTSRASALCFLEAASCRKPVVGGRSGGIEDAVVDGATGLLVAPESPEEIADALAQILTDPALASRLSEQNRARMVKEFTWPRMAQRVREILDAISREQPNQDWVRLF